MSFRFDPAQIIGLVSEVDEFVTVVRDMRAAQKRYFGERSQSALLESKQLEKLVDSYVLTWTEEEENRRAWMDSASP